jgi:damage-control phosphatase, subfamily I
MRTYLDCYPCFLRQGLDAARRLGADEPQQKRLLDAVLDLLSRQWLRSSPPQIGDEVHRLVRRLLGDGDPYRDFKEATTQAALALYPRLSRLMAEAEDRLETGVRLAIAGNIIDAGTGPAGDLWAAVERVLSLPLPAGELDVLREALAGSQEVLYLADNAGETVFDRLLIESLQVPVMYAVKDGPVLNDATLQDAQAAGLDRVARLLSTGSDSPGTVLERCSEQLRAAYRSAQLIIAKGQANYETLSEEGPRLFFLLQAKCPVIARDLGVSVGSIVLRRGGRRAVSP